jgi:hypothetical protein
MGIDAFKVPGRLHCGTTGLFLPDLHRSGK